MKKATIILVICLTMCFSLAFPASAAVVTYRPDIAARVNAAVTHALNNCPAGYPYIVLACNINTNVSAGDTLYAIYLPTPNLTSNSSKFYWRYYYVDNGSLTYTSTLDNYTGVSCQIVWADYGGGTGLYRNGASYKITHFIKDLSTGTLYNNDTYRPAEAWHATISIDISSLQALIATAKAKSSTGYTSASWQALQTAITAADNLLKSVGIMQGLVNTTQSNLQAALDSLTLLPDTTALKSLLTTAKAKQSTGHTATSWQALQDAISSTETMLNGSNYNSVQVELATTYLQVAIDSLILLPDTAALKALLTTAKSKQSTSYTATSWQELQNAITAADTLLASSVYTKSQTNTASDNLRFAIANLIPAAVIPNITDFAPHNGKYPLPQNAKDFLNIIDGVTPEHLTETKEAIFQNINIAKKFGLWIYANMILILIGVLIVHRFIHMWSGAFDADKAQAFGDNWKMNRRK